MQLLQEKVLQFAGARRAPERAQARAQPCQARGVR
ncbi:zinc finger protein [Musa troglodytarum]|uniref:Zinc finger protein n=1 Tax=Musa troglodytarum TaxID=320322 RepID=A0A9E7GVF3_9LILI|nr:zinc finger protein [Musa troglodytarum]